MSADRGAGEMEEAYSELYQQFLRLQSLCLKQAALLHQLTRALQKNQGATVPNRELSDMMSIPVQCTPEVPLCLHENPQANEGMLSNVLAQEMSKLCVDAPRQREENGYVEQKVTPLLSLDCWRRQGASSNASKNLGQADHLSGGRMMHTETMPVTDGPSLVGQSDGLLMSDVALQSHVCEFCQAVFPGDTTTRGEFLRHLCTHVT